MELRKLLLLADLEPKILNYTQPNPYLQNLSKFFHTSLHEDSETAFDQLKSNLIKKLLNPQLPRNSHTKYPKVLPNHLRTSSKSNKITTGKKRQILLGIRRPEL